MSYTSLSHMNERQFAQWIFDYVKSGEEHEAHEFFKLDGYPLFDPHRMDHIPSYADKKLGNTHEREQHIIGPQAVFMETVFGSSDVT